MLRFRASPHLFITLKLLAAVDISTTLRSFAIWCVVPSREKSRSRVNYYTITHDERERQRERGQLRPVDKEIPRPAPYYPPAPPWLAIIPTLNLSHTRSKDKKKEEKKGDPRRVNVSLPDNYRDIEY